MRRSRPPKRIRDAEKGKRRREASEAARTAREGDKVSAVQGDAQKLQDDAKAL